MISEHEFKKVRHLARTDLFFLLTRILGYDKFHPKVHPPFLNTLVSFKDVQGKDHVDLVGNDFHYTPRAEDPVDVLGSIPNRRMLLDPRGWFKTTANIIGHSIQIALNFPQATVNIVHAQEKVAQSKLRDIKAHFIENEQLRFFFPEFCVKDWKAAGNMSEFDIPLAKRKTGAPTFSINSISSAAAGMHYHWMKFTDCVEHQNSRTTDQCKKVRDTFAQFFHLLISPRYFVDVEGTAYDFDDFYNDTMDKQMSLPQEKRKWMFFVRGCFELQPPPGEVEHYQPDERTWPYKLDKDGNRISRFPDHDPLDELESMEAENENMFAAQKLNYPRRLSGEQPFPEEQMSWISVDALKHVPFVRHVLSVDLAEKISERTDSTAMIVCGVDRHGRTYVLDGVLGKYLPEQSVDLLFNLYKRWNCSECKIEESSFNRGLFPTIRRRMDLTHELLNFTWIKRDTNEGKKERILSLQPFFKSSALRFSEGLTPHFKEQLIQQFTRFPSNHDDALDALADQFQNRPYMGDQGPRYSAQDIQKRALEQALHRGFMEAELYGTKKEPTAWDRLGSL